MKSKVTHSLSSPLTSLKYTDPAWFLLGTAQIGSDMLILERRTGTGISVKECELLGRLTLISLYETCMRNDLYTVVFLSK